MPTRDSSPTGAPCWIDLWTSDVEGSRKFYSELFAWRAEEPSPEFGGYFMFTRDGVPVAGGMGDMGDLKANNTWKVYLETDDIAKTVEQAGSLGAQTIAPAMVVADLGSQAVLIDPTGATVGAWQPGTFPGLTVLGENGTPGWFELQTRDYSGAVGFYRSVFAWETNEADTPGFAYTTMRHPTGEGELAGIMDATALLGEDAPSEWSIYFVVEDIDGALAKLKALGGSVVTGAEDTPFGWLATVRDPAGAQFKLHMAHA